MMICAVIALIGGAILWFCHDWVPVGDPGKCRIMRWFGAETGRVRGAEPFLAWFRGFATDFVEVDRRFEIEVPEFKFDCPGDHIPLTASPSLIVEIDDNGGRQFNLSGGREGASKKIARIVKTEIQEFAANPNGEPMTYMAAKKMGAEFVLRAINELVDGDLLGDADVVANRDRFVEDLEEDLSEGSASLVMPQFGLILKGFNLGNFAEPKSIADAEAAKVAAARDAETKKANIQAMKERVDILTNGHTGVSFKDATMAVQIQEGTIKHDIKEEIIRIADDGNGLGALAALLKTAFGGKK
ncbi:MAG: hypothetical protein UX90_C0002G0129 [Candidatus Wolfebacteria bacterium GW2011_GWD2_47_17]|nr:MAG: hypothetical protein UX90_C0002G0129 [Candidatus Wolfebacteria bacterium GW2011_GWD2_47_17]